jgi:carotenoid cleavage dioxygenase-like enzyme
LVEYATWKDKGTNDRFIQAILNQHHNWIPKTETKVTGEIPTWLNGTLFRNGPGRYEYGDKKYNHLL